MIVEKDTLHTLLKTHFGYDSFRDNQLEIIQDIISGKDALVIMPTGGGKSMCFQLPALALPGTALVISPLIALMKDQVDALRAHGIKAAYYNSTQPTEEIQRVAVFCHVTINAFDCIELVVAFVGGFYLEESNGIFINLHNFNPY